MFFDIVDAAYVKDFEIRLSFEDGSAGIADLAGYPNADNVFRQFMSPDYFRKFRIEYETLVWGDGELDIAPETLYELATGIRVNFGKTESQVV